jgi:hypothetical protein
VIVLAGSEHRSTPLGTVVVAAAPLPRQRPIVLALGDPIGLFKKMGISFMLMEILVSPSLGQEGIPFDLS